MKRFGFRCGYMTGNRSRFSKYYMTGVFKTRNGEIAKWRNGEMTKWRNGEMELKTRATVIKYELPSEIGSCFHLLPNLFCG